MRILIFEYFCAGGGGPRVDPLVLAGARAILEAVLEDFAALPDARVLALRQHGLSLSLPPPHEARSVRRGGPGAAFRDALREVDAALVVAPERDGVLLRFTRAVERAGVLNLGCASPAVGIASDKWRTYRVLACAGVPQPWTARVPVSCRRQLPARVRRPPRTGGPGWILKPVDGYACLGVQAVPAGGDLRAALRQARAHTRRAHLLLQERREGTDASVTMLGDGRRAAPLCLNAQRLRKGERYEYLGGATPLPHPRARQAFREARRAAAAIPGLRGYFGIDLILEPGGVRVVEVNPRLTTSYLGLRRVAVGNPAGWILDAARRRALPARVRLRGRVEFTIACPTSSAGTSAASI